MINTITRTGLKFCHILQGVFIEGCVSEMAFSDTCNDYLSVFQGPQMINYVVVLRHSFLIIMLNWLIRFVSSGHNVRMQLETTHTLHIHVFLFVYFFFPLLERLKSHFSPHPVFFCVHYIRIKYV